MIFLFIFFLEKSLLRFRSSLATNSAKVSHSSRVELESLESLGFFATVWWMIVLLLASKGLALTFGVDAWRGCSTYWWSSSTIRFNAVGISIVWFCWGSASCVSYTCVFACWVDSCFKNDVVSAVSTHSSDSIFVCSQGVGESGKVFWKIREMTLSRNILKLVFKYRLI